MKLLRWFLAGLVFALCGTAQAETVTWECNKEADMKEYRGERRNADSQQWGVLFVVPHEPGCQTLKWTNPKYTAPGEKKYRLFAIDKIGNNSAPSDITDFKVDPSPIGNPGGQVEEPLPKSPVPTPPQPKPADMGPVTVRDVTETTAILEWVAPPGANVTVRMYSPPPMSWGGATVVPCASSPCKITNLDPGKAYVTQGIPFFGVMNQGALYGNFSLPTIFTTLKLKPHCADGVDNDGDGKIDFPGDPGCVDTVDGDETDPPKPVLAPCEDGLDNDGDGKIDYPNDPGCTSAKDTNETDPFVEPEPEEPHEPDESALEKKVEAMALDLAVLKGQLAAVTGKLDSIKAAACTMAKSKTTFAGRMQIALGGCP